MNLPTEIGLDLFIFALALSLIVGAIRGVIYSSSKGGHRVRKPLVHLTSKLTRGSMLGVGIILLVWFVFRISKLAY